MRLQSLFLMSFTLLLVLVPDVAYSTVESTLSNIQNTLLQKILPVCAILGLLFAGLSFVSGSQNARGHLMLAIIGAIVGFGAPSIVSFIQGLVQ